LLEIFSAQNIVHLKQKFMPQCRVLSKHCVPSSSSMKFSIVIHLIICSHEHKVQDYHMIQTQTTHREWVIAHHSRTQELKHNITQPINIDQYTALCNKYTNTQSYIQHGTLSV